MKYAIVLVLLLLASCTTQSNTDQDATSDVSNINKALKDNDINRCTKITDPSLQVSCTASVANNITLCSSLSSFEREDCIVTVLHKNGPTPAAVDMCAYIENAANKVDCKAMAMADTSICLTQEKKINIDTCVLNVLETTKDANICKIFDFSKTLGGEKTKDSCFIRAAVLTDDKTLCNSVVDEYTKNMCDNALNS